MPMIQVRHNIEVAHRLYKLPGKCENIHGHSMIVSLQIFGEFNSNGIFEGLDFGSIKKAFRSYLDTRYDHRLLLNEDDPWAGELVRTIVENDRRVVWTERLPGLICTPGDPTTENISKWVSEWALTQWPHLSNQVLIEETGTNGAGFESFSEGKDY